MGVSANMPFEGSPGFKQLDLPLTPPGDKLSREYGRQRSPTCEGGVFEVVPVDLHIQLLLKGPLALIEGA
jgi:hypothetical protein